MLLNHNMFLTVHLQNQMKSWFSLVMTQTLYGFTSIPRKYASLGFQCRRSLHYGFRLALGCLKFKRGCMA